MLFEFDILVLFSIKLLLIFHIWEIREVRYVVIVNDFRQ